MLAVKDQYRWHAPIEGVVRHTAKVEALMFSDARRPAPPPQGKIDCFTVPRNEDTSASWQDHGPPIFVNAEIAVAR